MEDGARGRTRWAPLEGQWQFEGHLVTYSGPADPASTLPHGLALSDVRLRSGAIKVHVTFGKDEGPAGRVVFGFSSATGAYFSIGLGGHRSAYVLSEYLPSMAWTAVRTEGHQAHLIPDSQYLLNVTIRGQTAHLVVNGVKVFEQNLPHPLTGDQVGLFAWGKTSVQFEGFAASTERPRAFVVMQFGEPFDSLYSDVIKTVAEDLEFEAYRADDVFGPGIVLQDIIRGINEAEVVIAEITPPNVNVFYELGYAHAMGKPTILLAERGRQLPFDISSYRCIFYDNTIHGKSAVTRHLKQHLENILEGA